MTKEIKVFEVLPELNVRGAMGRVVVPHCFPAAKKTHVTSTFFICCNRIFLTQSSLQKHKSEAGCSNDVQKSSKHDSDDDEAMQQNIENPISIMETIDPSPEPTFESKWDYNSVFLKQLKSPTKGSEFNILRNATEKADQGRKNKQINLKSIITGKTSNKTRTENHRNKLTLLKSKQELEKSPVMELLSLFRMTKTIHGSTEFKCRDCKFVTAEVHRITQHVKNNIHMQEAQNESIKKSFSNEHQSKSVDIGDAAIAAAAVNVTENSANSDFQKSKIREKTVSLFPRIHRCDLCSYESQYRANVAIHKQSAHVKDGSSCSLCSRVYRTQAGLNAHIVRDHLRNGSIDVATHLEDIPVQNVKVKSCIQGLNGSRPAVFKLNNDGFPCTKCPCVFRGQKKLKSHLRKIHNPYEVIVSKFELKNQFNRTEKGSSQASVIKYRCRFCLKSFMKKTILEVHYRRKHAGVEKSKHSPDKAKEIQNVKDIQAATKTSERTCCICQIEFMTNYNLLTHEMACHVKEGSFQCKIRGCNCVFENEESLQNHLYNSHPKNQVLDEETDKSGTFKCSFDSRNARDSESTNCAYSVVSGGRPNSTETVSANLMCDLCEFRVNNSVELKLHINASHAICGVQCECGYSFATATELTSHKNKCQNARRVLPATQSSTSANNDSNISEGLKTSEGFSQRKKIVHSRQTTTAIADKEDKTDKIENGLGRKIVAQEIKPQNNVEVCPAINEVKCAQCKNTFASENGLKKHIYLKHAKTGMNFSSCEICGCLTRNFGYYKMHKKTCHVTNGIKCLDCLCSFKTIEGLSTHTFWAHKKKLDRTTVELRCIVCDFVAFSQTAMDNHKEVIVHTNPVVENGNSTSANEHEIFQCELCQYSTNLLSTIQLHKTTNHVENGYKCEYCSNSFKSELGRRTHIFMMHKYKLSNISQCKLCNYHSTGAKAFRLHQQTCHVKNGIKCPDCACTMKHIEGLSSHLRMMHKKKLDKSNYVLKCDKCDYMTYSPVDFRRHDKVAHDNQGQKHQQRQEVEICNLCGYKIFSTIEVHLMKNHVQGGYECTDCKCSFALEIGLRRHLFQRHGKTMKTSVKAQKVRDPSVYVESCGVCEFRAKSKQALHLHCVKTHGFSIPMPKSPEKIRKCDLCQIKITYTLTEHKKRNHVLNGFKCSHCCCSFETYNRRSRHMIKVHNIVASKQCTECNLKFHGTIKRHIEKCHVIDGFKCDHCNSSFETEAGRAMHSRKQHQLSHLPKVSKCDLCGLTLTENLLRHKERCHVKGGLKCTNCCSSFESEKGLASHMRKRHSMSLSYKKKCSLCGIMPRGSMNAHLQHNHVGNGLKCTNCSCSFKTERIKIGHMIRYHNHNVELTTKKCDSCGMVLLSSFRKHKERNHVNGGHPCKYCPCSFRTEHGRDTHIVKMHKFNSSGLLNNSKLDHLQALELSSGKRSNQRIYTKECNKNFRGRFCRKILTYSERPTREIRRKPVKKSHFSTTRVLAKCNLCSMTVSNLKDHLKRNHVRNGLPCSRCTCRFSTDKGRSIHTQARHPSCIIKAVDDKQDLRWSCAEKFSTEPVEKPCQKDVINAANDNNQFIKEEVALTCRKCGYVATCTSNLNIHLTKSHVKWSPFPCDLCSCGYSSEPELLRHRKILHPEFRQKPMYIHS